MCTSVSYVGKSHYFGRNLDLDSSYNEEIVITPRYYNFSFKYNGEINSHYAIIGMAIVENEYPLYYDATNEKGLSIAALNYPKNAYYAEMVEYKSNVTSFEVIPWILTQCSNIDEAKKLLSELNITKDCFSKNFPTSPLHWMVSDRDSSIVVESDSDGVHIYDNPVGVLTNNPPFKYQLFSLNNYRFLSNKERESSFSEKYRLDSYSRGLETLGLPGGLSSQDRFVRACFTKLNSIKCDDENSSVEQFFHILDSVKQIKGLCLVSETGKYEYTVYSSCVNTDECVYYYTTYNNRQINEVKMYDFDLDTEKLYKIGLKK